MPDDAALDRLRNRGATCTGLANAFAAIMSSGKLRMYSFNVTEFQGFAAAAVGGDWAVMAQTLPSFGANTYTTSPKPKNLDYAIAHEMDHHLANVVSGVTDAGGHLLINGGPAVDLHTTVNSEACSGLY